jgi:predicted metal-binding protein
MQPIKPKWMNSGLVLVCERCYKERIPEEDPEKAAEIGDFHLRDWLKKRLKEDGHWGKVRAISTSCMDVCARRRVTVVIDPKTDDKTTEAFVIDPVADRETLYATIVNRLVTDVDGTSLEHYEDEKDAKIEAAATPPANR